MYIRSVLVQINTVFEYLYVCAELNKLQTDSAATSGGTEEASESA